MKKRLLSILFTLAVCVGLLSVTALATDDGHTHSYTNGFCTENGCGANQPAAPKAGGYQIANAGQLYWVAGLVNGDASVCVGDVTKNTAANAVLTENITVNTGVLNADGTVNMGEQNGDGTSTVTFRTWTPIGDMTYKNPGDGDPTNTEDAYAGSFNGQNYTISGLFSVYQSWFLNPQNISLEELSQTVGYLTIDGVTGYADHVGALKR